MTTNKPIDYANSNQRGDPSASGHLGLETAANEVRHLNEIERSGESEWTPWIALAGLTIFLLVIFLLVWAVVGGASRLLAWVL